MSLIWARKVFWSFELRASFVIGHWSFVIRTKEFLQQVRLRRRPEIFSQLTRKNIAAKVRS
jgi:hypothetical protein